MKTALYDTHLALAAKMVDFCGWQMPLYYKGIIPEHLAVRQHVGIFDVSHMGRIIVEGADAEAFLDYISTNVIGKKAALTATYSILCNEQGGCIDDVIVYKRDATHFFVIVNACNRSKDLLHLQQIRDKYSFKVEIEERYTEEGILSVQGPQALPLIESLFPASRDIKPMHFIISAYAGAEVIVSRTGYTGSDGFELYTYNSGIIELWNHLVEAGKPYGIVPVGLGARDTLRLEMGYALYGHEISDGIAPTESIASWTVKWDKPDFLGKNALEELEHSPQKRTEYGVVMVDKGIARTDYNVLKEGQVIGCVTSGTFSPTLNQAIAIVLVDVPLRAGEIVEIQIRDHLCKAKVIEIPFLRKQ